jgi:hypothetical protein
VTDERGGRGETTGETVEVHDSEGDGEVNVIDDGLSATVRSIGEANAAEAQTHLAEIDGPGGEAPVDAETLRIARKETQKGQETSKRQKVAFFEVLEACESQEEVADLLSLTQAAVSDRKLRWTDPRPLEDEGGENGESEYVCEDCGAAFDTPGEFGAHLGGSKKGCDEGDDDETPRVKNEDAGDTAAVSVELTRQEAFEIVHTAPTDTARRVFESVLEEVSE